DPSDDHERQCKIEHRVEEILGENDGESGGQQDHCQPPERYRLEGHSALLPALACSSALGALGGVCMSRSPLPVAHDGSNCRPTWCSRSLSNRRSRRSVVATSKDFIMMMASVGHTCTHSSQNSQAYSSSVKVLA